MCTSVFGCVPVFMHVVGRGGSRLSYSLPPSLLLLQTWSLTEVGARLTVGRPQQPSLLSPPLPCTGVMGKHGLAGPFMSVLGICTQVPTLSQQALLSSKHHLSPRTSFLKLPLDVAFGTALCSLLYLSIAFTFTNSLFSNLGERTLKF